MNPRQRRLGRSNHVAVLMAALVSMAAASEPNSVRYGLLKLTLFPEGTQVRFVPEPPEPASKPPSSGDGSNPRKILLPLGDYVVRLSHPDYQPQSLNVRLSASKPLQAKVVNLAPKPFDLVVRNAEPQTELYLNRQHLLTLREPNIVVSNLPGGSHEFALKQGSHLLERRFNSIGKSQVVFDNPRLVDTKTKANAIGALGLVPGLNTLLHVPRRSLGLMLPIGLLFYTSAVGYPLSKSQTTTWLSENGGQIPSQFFAWTMVLSSLAHALVARRDFLKHSQARLERLPPPTNRPSF